MKNNYSSLDNYDLAFYVKSILTTKTTLARYYELIEKKPFILKELKDRNLTLKNDFSLEKSFECLSKEENALFYRFIHLNDFIPRKLTDMELSEEVVDKLKELGIHNSGDFLLAKLDDLNKKVNKDLSKTAFLANLMRLPGVKSIRANLYFCSGLKDFEAFASNDSITIQEEIKTFISENARTESAPLLKELTTQIAMAKVLIDLDNKKR